MPRVDVPVILKGPLQYPPDANPRDVGEESPVECDFFGGVIDYIKQMLMEEDDSEGRIHGIHDYCALQAAEKYFYDALLSDKDSNSLDASVDKRSPDVIRSSVSGHDQFRKETLGGGDSSRFLGNFDGLVGSPARVQNSSSSSEIGGICDRRGGADIHSGNCENRDFGFKDKNSEVLSGEGRVREANSTNKDSSAKKNHNRGEDDRAEERNCKQVASYKAEQDLTERYDKLLLCTKANPRFYDESPPCRSDEPRDDEDEKLRSFRNSTVVKRGRPKGSKNQGKVREVIDLTNLLTRCAEAVSNLNTAAGAEILKQIRQHSSPHGDANERLSHCFANALEARMAGTGSSLYYASVARRLSAAEFLKSYRTYVTSCPFKRMSNIFANKSIGRYSRKASKIHIIDFGIGYGFQWPCFIQGVSLRPGGPPLLKLTGIDFPQPGFRPSERIEQAGRHLINYCKRFNVPFEYKAIAKRWEEVCLEDLDIESDEFLVVNCLYRLGHVPDESSYVDSPRDCVLKLIKKLNPELFFHGVINGTFNAPFFMTRFREALHHYSSFFDMVEATIPRDDQDRLMYEREVFGREVMNVIACEGSERIERPETYKQWQVRNSRAGFKQLALNWEILKEVRTKVHSGYHNYFLLDEDGEWMLQGWKGRVLYALSCWKPLP